MNSKTKGTRAPKAVSWDYGHIQTLSDEKNCYQLTEQEVNFFMAVHSQAQWATRWSVPDGVTMDDIQAFAGEALYNIMTPVDCGEGSGSLGTCYRLDSTSETFKFYPNDPFDINDKASTLIGARWRRMDFLLRQSILPDWIADLSEQLGHIGYFPNDIMSSYTDEGVTALKFHWFGIWDDLKFAELYPLPSVEWKCRGIGQFEIELCQLPAGGGAIITWDIDLSIGQIIDIVVNGNFDDGDNFRVLELNRDIISIPPELIPTQVQEIDFTEDIEHKVKVHFFPRYNDELPILFPYFGIREIEICGLEMFGWDTGEWFGKDESKLNDHIRSGVAPMATYDELCEAVVCAIEEVARRILFAGDTENIRNSIAIDRETGEVTIRASGIRDTGSKPVDTTSDDARAGGTYRQAQGIAELFAETATMKTNSFAASSVVNITGLLINPVTAGAWSTLMTEYYNSTEEIVINVDLLAEKLYCEVLGQAIVEYGLEQAHTEAEIDYLSRFVAEIPSSTMSDWFDEGTSSPRDSYLGYGCYTLPMESFTITPANYAVTLDNIWSQIIEKPVGNRWFFKINGYFTRSDGRIIDFLYEEQTDDTFDLMGVRVLKGDSTSSFTIFDSEPGYNANHDYKMYVTKNNSTLEYPGGFTFFVSVTDPETELTGQITIEKYDLGVQS